VLGYGGTLQEAQIQSVLACEYIKQNSSVDDLLFKSDVGAQAIEWYKTHVDRHPSATAGLTNGKKKKSKSKKRMATATSSKRGRGVATRRRTMKIEDAAKAEENEVTEEDDEDDEDEDDNEPMDFERAFGSSTDVPKLEHMDIHQNNGNFDDLHALEGDAFFDLTTKIDLKAYAQPALVSSTINLNPLAAVGERRRLLTSRETFRLPF
jgi:hypothetical protein